MVGSILEWNWGALLIENVNIGVCLTCTPINVGMWVVVCCNVHCIWVNWCWKHVHNFNNFNYVVCNIIYKKKLDFDFSDIQWECISFIECRFGGINFVACSSMLLCYTWFVVDCCSSPSLLASYWLWIPSDALSDFLGLTLTEDVAVPTT